MLKLLLDDAGLKPEVCAALLGIDPSIFAQWANGQRDLPGFILPELASVLGVDQEALEQGRAEKAPAIWFKFRSSESIKDHDRELVVLIRRLGFFAKQLNAITGFSGKKWQVHFDLIRKQLEPSRHESPLVQGEIAARTFRENVGLGFSHLALAEKISGPGDIVRGLVRNLGILVIEMPVPESTIHGCSFYVGEAGADPGTPCLFINTYRQNWFRRNFVLAHELAHAIFDIPGEAALVDYRDADDKTADSQVTSSVMEARADSFSRNCFASKEVLRALTAKLGLDWSDLTTQNLAALVAHAQVDLRVILASAVELQMLSQDQADDYSRKRIIKHLRVLTERALTTEEFFKLQPGGTVWNTGERETTIPSRSLRLPVPYIKSVIEATNSGLISQGKAAELLMVEYDTFQERFGSMLIDTAA